jgi:hypothetical protein
MGSDHIIAAAIGFVTNAKAMEKRTYDIVAKINILTGPRLSTTFPI